MRKSKTWIVPGQRRTPENEEGATQARGGTLRSLEKENESRRKATLVRVTLQ